MATEAEALAERTGERLADVERRLRVLDWQLIGMRQAAGDDERLAFWWGLVIGCWFAIFLTHYRIAFTRRGDLAGAELGEDDAP